MNNPARVLVVDDAPANLVAFQSVLEPIGAELHTAQSGDTALRQILSHDYAVIILDVCMPDIDGIETARLIRSRSRSRHVPILFITGMGHDTVQIEKAYSLGAVDYVCKPVSADILRTKVSVFVQLFRARRRAQVRAAELELANARLRAMRAEMEVKNDELEAFVRAASHDLRQPLGVIRGAGELLSLALSGEVQESVSLINDSADRMLHTMDGLLELTRAGEATIRRVDFDLATLVRQIVQALELTAKTTSGSAHNGDGHDNCHNHEGDMEYCGCFRTVIWDIPPTLPICADPNLLVVVMENLIGNAWKYTGYTKCAVIRVGQVEVEGQPVIFVSDNGAGFDPTAAEKLFQPFQRLHVDGKFHGNGIGLTTVRRIIERHGGCIWADARPGEGATFWFTLQPAVEVHEHIRRAVSI